VSRLIDISMPVSSGTPAWPGSPGARTNQLKSLAAGDEANATLLEMDVHTGTHLDAPSHMLREGATIDEHSLDTGVGVATVADTGSARAIDAEVLANLGLPDDCRRLLLRTQNSRRPELQQQFSPDYAALTLSGAEWVVERGIALVGIDYLSIQLFDDPTETHHVLFRAGVTILEGLRLEAVEPGDYGLACLPLRVSGVEASPARAVLQPANE
jgi:arylformamidase